MKKSIIMAALGVAGFAASSYGQGIIAFDTYLGHYEGGSIAALTYFNGADAGTMPTSGFSAELYYALGTASDPVSADATSILTSISGSFTALPSSITTVSANGYIQGPVVTIPNYVSGAITFEIALTGTGYSGRSGSFTESLINPAGSPTTFFGDNGPGPGQMMVASVPEPTTLALAGLGGLASLMALRRKQA